MKFNKQQLGASMWETSFYILAFLFVVTAVLKLGPLYIDDMNIGSAIDGVHGDLAGKDVYVLSNNEIREKLSRYFQVSMISDERYKDLQIERTANKVVLKLNYDVRQNFIGNIDIVAHFTHEVNLVEPFKK